MNILKQFDTVSASEEGQWVHLVIPGTSEPAYLDMEKQDKPLRIHVKGPDCAVWQAFQRKAMRANQEKEDKKTPLDVATEDSTLLSKMTLGWENIPDDSGKARAFSAESAASLYLNYKDIRVQVLQFIMDRANFTKGHLKA